VNYKDYKVGDRVIMKPARPNSSIGYKNVCGRVMTIKEIIPQLDWACTFEEQDEENTVYRMKDILRRAE
jgi:hypothetical protein